MAKKVGSFEGLENIIKQAVIETVKNELKDEAIQIVQEHIQSDVRNTYKPEVYNRSYQLENSLIGHTHQNSSGSQILLTIEHDENKMNYNSVMGYPVDGNELVDWIVSGDVYNLWNDDPSEAYLNPRPYMENAEQELVEKLDTLLRTGISKHLK